MRVFLTTAITLATLATTTPLHLRATPTSSARAFTLVANQTYNANTPLTPSLHGRIVNTIHVGAGASLAVLGITIDPPATGRIFYLNGTSSEWDTGRTHVLSDGGTPPFPWGLGVADFPGSGASGPGENAVTVSAGSGTEMKIARSPAPVPELVNVKGRGEWVGCDRYVASLNGNMTVLAYVYAREGEQEPTVPEGCTVVKLLAQCAELGELPEGSTSSHEFALTVKCYEDVWNVDWSL